MAETQEQKKRGEHLNELTRRFAERNNSNMMNFISRIEENTKKQNDANEQRIKEGKLTQSEINDLKEVVETQKIDGRYASQEQIAIAQRQIDIAERGSSTLIDRVREQSDKFVEDARSKERQRVADLNLRKEELVQLKEMAEGVGTFSPEEQAAAQLELKRYEENQKKIGIFTKIANRTVQKLEDIGADPEGESAEAKEQRLAGQKVFGKIRDGVMKTGEAFDEFAGKYGKQVKEGGLALLKGFGIGLIIISLLKFIKSPAFDELLESLGGFFGFIDSLVETFGLATTLTLGIVALFKPKLLLLPLKGAIAALKFGYKLLSSETYRSAISLKFTNTFKSIGKATTFLGSKMKLLGTNIMSIGKSVGTSALSLGSKALVGLKAAGIFMKTTLIALGKGLLSFATTTLMPMLVPLAPFIAIGAAIAAVLYSLYEGFQSFRDSLASGDSLVEAIISGVSTALATLITLPAVMFQKLLEFATGLLGFDDLSERIGNVDIVGTITGLIKDGLNFIKDFFVDLFTFDDDLFPSFGDFGSFFQKATASLLRSVLPAPDAFTFTLPKLDIPFVGEIGGQTISLNPVPDSVYEAAGINPETGETMTKANTAGIDGVESTMVGEVSKLEEDKENAQKEIDKIDRIQTNFIKRADAYDKMLGTTTDDALDRTNKDYARYYMKRQKELETLESELAASGGELSEGQKRDLELSRKVNEEVNNQIIRGDAINVNFALDEIKQEEYEKVYRTDEFKKNIGANLEAVDDKNLITNQFRGMDGIDVSGQKLEDSKTIIEGIKTKTTGGIDAVAGGVKSQVDAITKLIDPEQIEAMRNKVTRINQILKDGITEEERKELGTLGVNIRAPGRGRTLSEAVLTQRATSEAVAARDVLLANNADMREVQKTASNISNVVSPTYNTSNSSSSVSMPIPHDNKDLPVGVNVASLTR